MVDKMDRGIPSPLSTLSPEKQHHGRDLPVYKSYLVEKEQAKIQERIGGQEQSFISREERANEAMNIRSKEEVTLDLDATYNEKLSQRSKGSLRKPRNKISSNFSNRSNRSGSRKKAIVTPEEEYVPIRDKGRERESSRDKQIVSKVQQIRSRSRPHGSTIERQMSSNSRKNRSNSRSYEGRYGLESYDRTLDFSKNKSQSLSGSTVSVIIKKTKQPSYQAPTISAKKKERSLSKSKTAQIESFEI